MSFSPFSCSFPPELSQSEIKEEKANKPSSKTHRRLANIHDFLDSSDTEDVSSSSSTITKKPEFHHQKERIKLSNEEKSSFGSEKSVVTDKSNKDKEGEKIVGEKTHKEKDSALKDKDKEFTQEKVKPKKKKHDEDQRLDDSYEGSSEKKKKKKHKKEKHADFDPFESETTRYKEFKEKSSAKNENKLDKEKQEFKEKSSAKNEHKLDKEKQEFKEKSSAKNEHKDKEKHVSKVDVLSDVKKDVVSTKEKEEKKPSDGSPIKIQAKEKSEKHKTSCEFTRNPLF